MSDTDSGGIVSEQELSVLCDFFRMFEGASEPLSEDSKGAKISFTAIAHKIYFDRVRDKFLDIDFQIFLSMVRRECRTWISKETPPFKCP